MSKQRLSTQLMQDLARSGLIKKAATAPVPADPAGMPAAAPQTVPPAPDPAMAGQLPMDPNALAAMLSQGALGAGAPPPADPAAMGAPPPADPSLAGMVPPPPPAGADPMAALAAMGLPPQGTPVPPPELSPPVDGEDEKDEKEGKVVKALEDLTDQLKSLSDRIDAMEKERDTEKEWSALPDLTDDNRLQEPDAPSKDGTFHRLLHKVFPNKA